MLLKDGEKEIWLCVKHVFLNKREIKATCSEGLSRNRASQEWSSKKIRD